MHITNYKNFLLEKDLQKINNLLLEFDERKKKNSFKFSSDEKSKLETIKNLFTKTKDLFSKAKDPSFALGLMVKFYRLKEKYYKLQKLFSKNNNKYNDLIKKYGDKADDLESKKNIL